MPAAGGHLKLSANLREFSGVLTVSACEEARYSAFLDRHSSVNSICNANLTDTCDVVLRLDPTQPRLSDEVDIPARCARGSWVGVPVSALTSPARIAGSALYYFFYLNCGTHTGYVEVRWAPALPPC